MIAEFVRRFLYATALLMMMVVMWVSTWSNQLYTQAHQGWWPPAKLPGTPAMPHLPG